MPKSHFGRRVISDIGDITASTDRPNSMDNTHKYLACPYVSKVRLFVRDIRVKLQYIQWAGHFEMDRT